MKQFTILLIVLLFSSSIFAQSSMDDTSIARTIERSQSLNSDILDPNLIFPGQVFKFKFADGFIGEYLVKDGDNEWSIIRDYIKPTVEKHGDVANLTVTYLPGQLNESSDSGIPSWVSYIALLLAIMLIAFAALYITKARFQKDDAEKSASKLEDQVKGLNEDLKHSNDQLGRVTDRNNTLVDSNNNLESTIENLKSDDQWQKVMNFLPKEELAFVMPNEIPDMNSNPEDVATVLHAATRRALRNSNVLRIEDVTPGRIYGSMRVISPDGTQEEVKFENGENAWEATIVFDQNGKEVEKTAYWRAACMNLFRETAVADVDSSNIRFVPIDPDGKEIAEKSQPVEFQLEEEISTNLPVLASDWRVIDTGKFILRFIGPDEINVSRTGYPVSTTVSISK